MKIPHAAKLFCVILDVTILNHAACIPVPHQRCYMYYNAAILMYLRVPPFGGGTGTSFTVRHQMWLNKSITKLSWPRPPRGSCGFKLDFSIHKV